MSIGFICQPCGLKPEKHTGLVESALSTDGCDCAIRCLSVAFAVGVIAILIHVMTAKRMLDKGGSRKFRTPRTVLSIVTEKT